MQPKRNWPIGIGLALIHLGAIAAFFPQFFSWSAVLVAFLLYNLTGQVGISLLFHRSLTHRSFKLAKPLEYVAAIFGSLALQGGPIEWVSTHRKHHAHTDAEGDPHNVHLGFSWAHVTWLFRTNPAALSEQEMARYAPDLVADPFYRNLERISPWLTLVLAGILFLMGGWSFVVWGIFARLVFTYHVTWCVNSAAHMTGYRSFHTGDMSTNCWWVALLSWGEGWHNNHHAFPFSARHGMRWFEIDTTWILVKALTFARLCREVRVPTSAMLDRLRVQRFSPER